MPVIFVTALYVIPNKNRGVDAYLQNLEKLIQTGIPLLCYLDESLKENGEELCKHYKNFKIQQYVTLDTSWIPGNVILPAIRNGKKDTKEYFAVQLQKMWCLADAAKNVETSHLAWIDAGIFHMFNNYNDVKEMLLQIASSEWPNKIFVPGAWNLGQVAHHYALNKWAHMLDVIIWRFLGSFLIGPRLSWQKVLEKQDALVKENLPRLGWEVNYWTKMEDDFIWYLSNHNNSLLENIQQFRQLQP